MSLVAKRSPHTVTDEDASFLERHDLPAGFERWRVVIPPGATRATHAAEWAGALVRVESGTLEVWCLAGGHEAFHAGDLVALGWVPITELRNPGTTPVRIVAVRRRGPPPSAPYLHVTRFQSK
jgi:hypothetical protein